MTLSPTNNLKGAAGGTTGSNPSGATGGCFEANSSTSCSPPSVCTDLTPLNPQEHFDPDFDVVDDMKFIDSLIRTIPEQQQQQEHSSQQHHHHHHHHHHGAGGDLAHSYHANTSNKKYVLQ